MHRLHKIVLGTRSIPSEQTAIISAAHIFKKSTVRRGEDQRAGTGKEARDQDGSWGKFDENAKATKIRHRPISPGPFFTPQR